MDAEQFSWVGKDLFGDKSGIGGDFLKFADLELVTILSVNCLAL